MNEYATTDAEWAQWIAVCSATWRDCHLVADEAASLAYRRALRRVPYGPLIVAVDMLSTTRDHFPSLADLAGVISEIREDLRRTEEAERLARVALPSPKTTQTLADFDAHAEVIANEHKSELQEFARRQGYGADWLAARFAAAARPGAVTTALRQRISGEIAPEEFTQRFKAAMAAGAKP